jgi:hypothetical protein
MSLKSVENKLAYGLLVVSIASGSVMKTNPAIAQQKTCILTDSGQKTCSKIIQPNGSSPDKPLHPSFTLNFPRTDYSFNFQLIKCVRKLRTVDCKISIVKVGGEAYADLGLTASSGANVSQATDEQDEDYNAKQLIIGNETTISYTSARLNTSQPISIVLSFEIPQKINTLKKLTLQVEHIGMYSKVPFSNVNFSQP